MRGMRQVGPGLLALLLLSPIAAQAQSLTFEGLQHREFVQSYYDGGTGSLGSGPGPDLGITFSDNALVGSENSAEANWTNTPSFPNILLFLTGTGAVMNAPGGFSNGFSFWYSSTTFGGTVNVFDGLNGTGMLLATLDLVALGACPGADTYCNWAPIGVDFMGTARSVDFGGTANQIGFDNITINSSDPGPGPGTGVVPEPFSVVLMGTGLLGVAVLRRRRRTEA